MGFATPGNTMLQTIEQLKSRMELVWQTESCEFYSIESPYGRYDIKLYLDSCGYLNRLGYRLHSRYGRLTPALWTVTTPEEFSKVVLSKPEISYELLGITSPLNPGTLPKPAELKGIKPIGSILLYGGRVRNPAFLLGDALYIRCGDYFSSSVCMPEDIDTPLSYRLKKYTGRGMKDKLGYPDAWGDVVARSRAWMKFDHFVTALGIYDNSQISQACADILQEYHHWDTEPDASWMAYFEGAAALARNAIDRACAPA